MKNLEINFVERVVSGMNMMKTEFTVPRMKN